MCIRASVHPCIRASDLASSVMTRQSDSDRITVTLPSRVFMALRDRADREGRSTSNLAAHLLEVALDAMEGAPPIPKRWPNKAA